MTRFKMILLGLFKRLICFPIGVIIIMMCILSIITLFIPDGLYWLISGRNLWEDTAKVIDYSLSK